MTGDTELGQLLHDPFPEPEPATEQLQTPPRARRHFRRPGTLTTIVIVVVLIAAAGGIWVATGSSAATYRWTTVDEGRRQPDARLLRHGDAHSSGQRDIPGGWHRRHSPRQDR